MADDGSIKIDVINAHFPKQLMEMVRNIYQDPNTNKYTKDIIVFELKKIFGNDTDIIGFLQSKEKL